MLSSIEPINDFLQMYPDIFTFSVKLNQAFTIIIFVLGILSVFLIGSMIARKGRNNSGILIAQVIIVLVVVILVTIMPNDNWFLDVVISNKNIPVVISTIIGITGAYIITCYVSPNTKNHISGYYHEYVEEMEE
jgi:hypothetical protein